MAGIKRFVIRSIGPLPFYYFGSDLLQPHAEGKGLKHDVIFAKIVRIRLFKRNIYKRADNPWKYQQSRKGAVGGINLLRSKFFGNIAIKAVGALLSKLGDSASYPKYKPPPTAAIEKLSRVSRLSKSENENRS
jgi:hypothetical protein